MILYHTSPVWPYVKLKNSPNIPKAAQNEAEAFVVTKLQKSTIL